MAEIANMGYVVDEAVWADWADGADRADGTNEIDMAEMALHNMNTLFYFDCLGHKEFKNIAYNALWSDGWMDGMGWIINHRLL